MYAVTRQSTFRVSGLGALPAIPVVAGAALEAAFSWYDPDLFLALRAEGEFEEEVALLNNYWHELERTASTLGVVRGRDEFMVRLDGHMEAWWRWKQAFERAAFVRWVPFYGTDWDAEFTEFRRLFEEDVAALEALVGEDLVRKELTARAVVEQQVDYDPSLTEQAIQVYEDLTAEAGKSAGRVAARTLFWPSVAAVASVGLIAWLLYRSTPPARRRPALQRPAR